MNTNLSLVKVIFSSISHANSLQKLITLVLGNTQMSMEVCLILKLYLIYPIVLWFLVALLELIVM